MNTKKGFTILYAVLVSGLLLSIGIGVYNIAIKELRLSVVGSNSQIAIFAADTGLECALYWELKTVNGFDWSNVANGGEPEMPPNMNCLGVDYTQPGAATFSNIIYTTDGDSATTVFTVRFSEGYCARVYVGKDVPTNKVIIESRGYNMDCDSNNLKKVERALRVRL